jgi:hypothetical protein
MAMMGISKSMMLTAAVCILTLSALAQSRDNLQHVSRPGQQGTPAWVKRGIPGEGHAALAPLVGSWRVEQSVYGTMGRSPDLPPMIYQGKPGSGVRTPIEVTGVFTDQGVVNEQTVGKPVAQRTVIRIEGNDRNVFELYFTPPGGKEQLALRLVYTRIK